MEPKQSAIKVHALLPSLPSIVDWLTLLGNNHSVMPQPTFVPVTDGGTGADEIRLELTGGDIVAGGAGAGAGAGAGDGDGAVGAIVDADAGENMLERLTGSDVVGSGSGSGSFTSHYLQRIT